jgi:hypothetical protein
VRPRGSLTACAAMWVFWFACLEDKFVEIQRASRNSGPKPRQFPSGFWVRCVPGAPKQMRTPAMDLIK